MRIRFIFILILLFYSMEIFAWDLAPSRRRAQYFTDFGYFIYPIAGRVPGLGSAAGGGATFTNIAKSDTDVTGFSIDGDFSAAGVTVLNMHLVPERLILDTGLYNYHVFVQQFDRGIDSSKDDVLYVDAEGEGATGQLTLTFLEKRLDFFARLGVSSNKVNSVLDSKFNRFENIDTNSKQRELLTFGLTLDLTDDRQDPRNGIRFEVAQKKYLNDVDPYLSTYAVQDTNLSIYFPVGAQSTWVWNYFQSKTKLDKRGETDYSILRDRFGLSCGKIQDPAGQAECEATEDKYIKSLQDYNRYGDASSLGGTQRLRAYPGGRYRAGYSVFYGTEFRWNLTDERVPMDWFILKGYRTNVQLAFFAEAGGVSDQRKEVHKNMKYAYGAGLRVLFEGVTIRFDVATGSEGSETQLFLDYPFSMFSVDNPG